MLVRFQVTRTETWFPEYEVPDHMTNDEVLEYIADESPASVFDEMLNKYTLDTDIDVEIA
tara:strand:+ start:125 stop:304 length:180 start_codon:yes stop_codon:yes gene_type:complete